LTRRGAGLRLPPAKELIVDIDPDQPTEPINREQFLAGLRALGLQSGDNLLVHGALSSFGHVEGGAQAVIDTLLRLLGPRGTLVMPYFLPLYEGVYDCAQPPLPYTGALPRQLRTQPGALLSVHPSHPVIALGPAAMQITDDHYQVSAVGRGSPIDRLAKLAGKVLLLGVGQSANTTIHTGEAYAAVPYWGRSRPDRPTGRWMILSSGQRIWVPLPETPGDSAGFVRIEPLLIERHLITLGRIGSARCWLMPGQPLIEAVVEYLGRDPAGLLCQQPDCAFCMWAGQLLVPQP
jgi:aminoglycoside 3-N-acetyltransferase